MDEKEEIGDVSQEKGTKNRLKIMLNPFMPLCGNWLKFDEFR